MKLKLEITAGSQIVECAGHPLELLMELTVFFSRQEECRHLLKHSILLAETVNEHVKNGKLDLHSIQHDEGKKILADFMKRYNNGSQCDCENCKPKKN